MGKISKSVRRSVAKKSLKVAIVITVFNEEDNIRQLVRALREQTFPPSEVVIVDGGSNDNTYSILEKESQQWPTLKLFKKTGNRSVGRNFGVLQTHAPVIAFTDAGCLPHHDWLEELVKPFTHADTQVVSGYYEGLAKNSFEKSLIPYVLVMPDQAQKSEFFPSTRSMAIRRKVWDQSGGFDIRLFHNEDYAYAHWLKKMGMSFIFAPSAVVSWIPRKNLSQAAWMFLRFAIGDAQSGIIRPKVRMIIGRYVLFAYVFLLALEWQPLLVFVFAVMTFYILWSISKNYRYVKSTAAFYWLPILQITSDLMVIAGTVMGLLMKK